VAVERPRLILLDLMMPEMDGFEFMEALRANPDWRGTPVIVITAKELTEEDHRRLNNSVRHIIGKANMNREKLLALVRDSVKQRV